MYLDTWPVSTTIFTATMLTVYHVMDQVDGKHAISTRNTSPLGFLINMGCDFVSVPFSVISYMMVMGVQSNVLLWYLAKN